MRDIQCVISGFKRFKKQYFCHESVFYDALTHGQRPKVLTIACCDSRVDPAILMNCQPGDMFVVRNVANIVPPYEAGAGLRGVCAALEYGVTYLRVEHLIVLGHSCCGGIEALMAPDHEKMGEFIFPWVSIVEGALKRVEDELAGESAMVRQRACELASILISLENLMTFPWIRTRIEDQTLHLHGWYFDMGKGELLGYQPETGRFDLLVGE
jgi:carbonic anhydrase